MFYIDQRALKRESLELIDGSRVVAQGAVHAGQGFPRPGIGWPW